jgi:hypothetical protein
MKKLKISRKRLHDLQEWVERASDQQLGRYTNLVTPSLQKAAETFHLDPHSEWHCEILVRILAALVFGKGKKGRPHSTYKWPPPRDYDLALHYFELKREEAQHQIFGSCQNYYEAVPERICRLQAGGAGPADTGGMRILRRVSSRRRGYGRVDSSTRRRRAGAAAGRGKRCSA